MAARAELSRSAARTRSGGSSTDEDSSRTIATMRSRLSCRPVVMLRAAKLVRQRAVCCPHSRLTRRTRSRYFDRLTYLSLSRGEAPCASGRAARRLPQLTSRRRAASASGVTPCISGRKEGLQPRASGRPAVGCSEKLGGAACAFTSCRVPARRGNAGTRCAPACTSSRPITTPPHA